MYFLEVVCRDMGFQIMVVRRLMLVIHEERIDILDQNIVFF